MKRIISSENIEILMDESSPLKTKSKIAEVFTGISENKKILIKKLKAADSINHTLLIKLLTEHKINCEFYNKTDCHLIKYENNVFISRPFLEGISLDNYLKSIQLSKNSKEIILEIWIKTLLQLKILHNKNIIHRDIKPSNILINTENEIRVHLIDFGQSNFVNQQDQEKRIPFSLIYSPPEQVLNFRELCGFPSDFYALGLTMYEVFTKTKAFKHFNPELLMNMMISMPLDFSEIKDTEIARIIKKSSFKSSLGKPPGFYNTQDLKLFLINDISHRYQKIEDYIGDLEILKSKSVIGKRSNNLLKRLLNR